MLEPLRVLETNSLSFPCAKDFVVLEIPSSRTDRKLEDTYVAFFRNAQRVSLTKMLVRMYVNMYIYIFFFLLVKWKKMRTYVYHLWLLNCTLGTLTTSLCGKGLYRIYFCYSTGVL